MNHAIQANPSMNTTILNEVTPMIVFSEERREAIHSLKAIIRAKDAHSHGHFVLYAALRGQDVRKTSHMPQGENAIEVLEDLMKAVDRYKKGYSIFFSHLKSNEGEYLFSEEKGNLTLLTDILEEAKTVTEATPEANDGVNTLAASQRR